MASVASVASFSLTFAGGLGPRPQFVPLAPPDGVPDQHVAVVALVGDEGVEGDRVVDDSPVLGLGRDRTDYGWTEEIKHTELRDWRLVLREHCGSWWGLQEPSA